MDIFISKIKEESYVDGPDGPRTVIWFAGCRIRCKGCQNPQLWVRRKEQRYDVSDIANAVLELSDGRPITITGGEPFDQELALLTLLTSIRITDALAGRPRRHIMVYTGYTLAQLVERWEQSTFAHISTSALAAIDVLVDGPYMVEQDDDSLQWRGSRNQRAIDVQATLMYGDTDNPVTLDWDTQVIQIVNGHIVMTGAMFKQLGMTGTEVARCGEVAYEQR